MIGTLINVVLILAGCALGLLLRKGLPERLRSAVMQSLGLAVIFIGISGTLEAVLTANADGSLSVNGTMCIVISMAVGGLLGSALGIERRLDQLGQFAERKMGSLAKGQGSVSKGFVTASLVYCVGAMAIVGSINSGIRGDHSMLITKGILDGVSAIIFTSTLGIGVALSALAVLVYQGAIGLLAGWLAPVLSTAMINGMSAVGGLLIVGIGLNMLYEDHHIPVGDLLPAILIPLVYLPLKGLFA